ncbi:nucleotidyltransferase family protein [Winogradskyella tangerina]|uniref:nucleotidyltransferase family protein n=1 Tax=Winogradskyella tangerina TaxID=2023240 RepID=UPI000DBE81D5|nr:nucleotidyltransferase family protein [Winogradskyella tangerina]
MANLATIYQHIADILSFENSSSALESKLSDSKFNWDDIVVEGSRHLMLPAIYCRLKQKELTHLLPIDLKDYLKEITQLNKDRNLAIIRQIKEVSELFNNHLIDYVFIKGTALLMSETYGDISERMLNDIDILVNTNHLKESFELLIKEGYYPSKQTLKEIHFEHRHLPRLKTDQFICAIELHGKLFKKNNHLSIEEVLSQKERINKVFVPSKRHLIEHNILNYQINDNGYFFNAISFRSAFDTVSLLQSEGLFSDINSNKYTKRYFNLIALFFEDISARHIKTNQTFITTFYRFKLKHIRFYKIWHRFLSFIHFFGVVLGRLPHFFTNSAYRAALLKDRKRIFGHFKSVFGNS